VYTIVKKNGQEPKWFSPCMFIYLLTVVPPIWIFKMDMLHFLRTTQPAINGTECIGLNRSSYYSCNIDFGNYSERFSDCKQLVNALTEIMLLLLIIGRWMLPKGHVTREQLSQLLFAYFGFAFDIMELFDLFKEREVFESSDMQYVIFSLCTISLMQFTIVITAVKSRRLRQSMMNNFLYKLTSNRCCQSEMWGLMTTVVLQDGPFLILRLYCLIGLHIKSDDLILYTGKNILVIMLQSYRLAVLVLRCKKEIEEEKTMKASTISLPPQSQNGDQKLEEERG
jgi:hypothetical protein